LNNEPNSWCKCYLDAYAACALYLAKNEKNSESVFRYIETNVGILLDTPEAVKPIEQLACAQSLLLYQIIRLFDGDVSLTLGLELAIFKSEV
jgi:hypothetical protein